MKHFSKSNLFSLVLVMLVSQIAFAQKPTEAEIAAVASTITTEATSPQSPVAMSAGLLKTEIASGNKAYAVMKVSIHKGWHIYAYVPEGGYFIMSQIGLDTPSGISSELIEEPDVEAYKADPQIFIYKGELLFVYEITGANAGSHNITANLSFQACDPYKCLPPDEASKKITLTVK